jgi:hypothetical protein
MWTRHILIWLRERRERERESRLKITFIFTRTQFSYFKNIWTFGRRNISAKKSAVKLHKLININQENVILLLNFLFNFKKFQLNSTPRSQNYTRFKTALSYLRQLYEFFGLSRARRILTGRSTFVYKSVPCLSWRPRRPRVVAYFNTGTYLQTVGVTQPVQGL